MRQSRTFCAKTWKLSAETGQVNAFLHLDRWEPPGLRTYPWAEYLS